VLSVEPIVKYVAGAELSIQLATSSATSTGAGRNCASAGGGSANPAPKTSTTHNPDLLARACGESAAPIRRLSNVVRKCLTLSHLPTAAATVPGLAAVERQTDA
jgi:hypothetical protein